MPPKRRHWNKNKKDKQPAPVFFGPEPPPKQEDTPPPSSSYGVPPPSEQGEEDRENEVKVEVGKHPTHSRKKKLPRKKWGKESKGEWANDNELPPQDQDEGRYDLELPWDLRLLRAIDESRSLRSFRDRHPLNFQTIMYFLQADVKQLRGVYDAQALRGYGPETDLEDNEPDEDEDDPTEDPLSEAQLSAEGSTRMNGASASCRFQVGEVLRQPYKPTLERITASFLRFLLTRNVFPRYSSAIKDCLRICDIATKQLLPSFLLLKQLTNHSSLTSALNHLFPKFDSTLALPLDFSAYEANAAVVAREAAGYAEKTDLLDVPHEQTGQSSKSGGSKSHYHGKRGHGNGGSKEEKGKEKEVETSQDQSSWTKPLSPEEEATALAKRLAEQVEVDVKIRNNERSARTLLGWELVAGTTAVAAADAKARAPPDKQKELEAEQRKLAAREDGVTREMHDLDHPLEVIVDFPPAYPLEQLTTLTPCLFETDLVQLVFLPFSPSPPGDFLRSFWIISPVHRVIPFYWSVTTDILRFEPGTTVSSGEWGEDDPKLEEVWERLQREEEQRE
ncbi:hypothetical protein JCM8547_003526 [Rhodosporidiobolus lusitaniae]